MIAKLKKIVNARALISKQKLFVAFSILLVLFPLLLRDPYILHVLITIFLSAFIAESWNLIGGYAGQLSLGHAAFFGLGAYTSSLLFVYWNISPWLGMLLGGIISVLLAVAIGSLCFRLRGPFFVLTTLGFAEILRIVTTGWKGVTRGPMGVLIPIVGNNLFYYQFTSKTSYYYVILIMMLAIIIITGRIEKSKLGFYLKAIRDDEDAARSLGVNAAKCKITSLAISAFLTALAGTFYAQYIFYIDPETTMGFNRSVAILLPTILGGAGTVWGPVFGSFLLVPISEMILSTLGGTYAGVHLIIYGIALMAVTILLPGGMVEWTKRTLLPVFRARASPVGDKEGKRK